jgi:hypothetical protein
MTTSISPLFAHLNLTFTLRPPPTAKDEDLGDDALGRDLAEECLDGLPRGAFINVMRIGDI